MLFPFYSGTKRTDLKKYSTLALKIVLWVIGILIFLVLLIFVLIRVPAVQNAVKGQVVHYLEKKIGTRVEIGRVSLDLPKLLVLENIYFEDQKKDTLFAGDTLKVDISMLKLLKNQVELNELDFRGIHANIHRGADSVFNFDYIVKAFMSDKKKEPEVKDTTSAMKFSLDRINLDRIHFSYKDEPTANDVSLYIGHFDTRVKKFDLDHNRYDVPKINLAHVNARIIQRKPAVDNVKTEQEHKEEAEQPLDFDFQFNTLDLAAIKVYYQNDLSALKADVNLGKLLVGSDKLDMKSKQINLNKLNLHNSTIKFAMGKHEEARKVTGELKKAADAASDSWKFNAADLDIQGTDIRFDDNNSAPQRAGMDFAHLDIKDLNLNARDLVYKIDTISGKLNSGSFKDKSGFDLRKLQASFFYGAKEAYLNDLDIQTARSHIKDHIRVTYPSIESLSKNIGELGIDARLNRSKIAFTDVVGFVPSLANTAPIKGNLNTVLAINTEIKGKVKDLNIKNLEVSGLRNTSLKLSARTKGLPDMNKAWLDARIDRFNTSRGDIMAFTPKGTVPATISLPQAISLKGTFKGFMTNFNTDLNLSTSDGSAKAIASYNASRKGAEKYNADVRIFNFNAGRVIKNKDLGRITLAANVKGTGIDPKRMSADVAAKLIKAEFKGYSYRNLAVNGVASNGYFKAKANMADPNIRFDLNTVANMKGRYPAIKLNLDLDSIDFKKTNLMKDDLRLHGRIVADLKTADPDYLNGEVRIVDALIAKEGERYGIDSISLVSTASADSNSLKLQSELMSANLAGKYKLTQLGDAMQDLISRYFDIGAKGKKNKYDPAWFTFNARVTDSKLLRKFAPDLKEMSTIALNGEFDSRRGLLNVDGSVPRVKYGTNDVSNLLLKVNTADSALTYALNVDKIMAGQLQLLKAKVQGDLQNNVLRTEVSTRDDKNKENYRIGASLKALKDVFELSLRENSLVLNYQPWNVNAGNSLMFGKKGIQAKDFILSNDNQRLSINTSPPGFNNPLLVDMSNFRIETLTNFVKKDSMLIGGTINGNVQLRNLQATPVFIGDLNVADFSFRGDTVGNIAIKVNNETENALAASVAITGQGNQADIKGFYYLDKGALDFDMNLANLNMKSIEGFTMGNLKNSKGSLQGRFKVSGTASAPVVRGDLNFNQVAFTVAMLNGYYRINDKASINVNDQGIRFSNFTLIDSANNEARLRGAVYTTNFSDFRFDMSLNADNFKVINSTAKDNDMYYGKLLIDSRLNIKGTLKEPAVDGSLKINPETNVTLVLPQKDPALEERQGIVVFVDKSNPQRDSIFAAATDSAEAGTALTGMDVSVNIELSKEAIINVIVDPGNGDALKMRGTAQLSAGIDPSGKTSLVGNLTIEEGSYNLSLGMQQKQFLLNQGSTITWNGDPLMADINITATYVAKTAPIDLVEAQLGSAAQTTLNTYKQKLPFNVNLILKGELMKPLISFDILLPEGNYLVSSDVVNNVNGRLSQLRQDPAEMNKQVFALLLLNRFVSENPFESKAGGTSVESMARQSVSRLLSDQLNNLTKDLIQGVELDFDLQSTDDYTTGEKANRTDLNVGLSKRMLDDRLKVTVGSNFELEGPRQQNRKTSNIAGDIQVEYQLTKNGRYLIRAYQKNEYQVALQGQVVETGLSFIVTMDYNKFREIFGAPSEEEKQLKKERKEARREEKREERRDKKNNNND